MMAAQGSDLLWIRSSFSLVFFVITATGAKNGTLVYVIASFTSLGYVLEACTVVGFCENRR